MKAVWQILFVTALVAGATSSAWWVKHPCAITLYVLVFFGLDEVARMWAQRRAE